VREAKVVPSIERAWTEFKSYVATYGPGLQRPERPKQCRFCDGQRVWFDGWRVVFAVVLSDGEVHRCDDGLPLQRVVCAVAWCGRSWTLRPSFLYPHRTFQLDVVEAAATAYLISPHATYLATAIAFRCSPRSVWRWVGWSATLAPVPEVVGAIERRSGAGQSPYLIPREVPQDHPKARSSRREGVLLRALQLLTTLVLWARAQIAPPADPSPLRFFLGERFRAFRRLDHLVPRRSSPPSPVSGPGPPALKGEHGLRRRDR
jgi:hypothetical protein